MDRNPWLQPSDNPPLDIVPVGGIIGNTGREPDVGKLLNIGFRWEQQLETGRRHSHNNGRLAAGHRQRLADHSGVAAEAPLEVFVAQHAEHWKPLWRRAALRRSPWRRLRLRPTVGVLEIAAKRDLGAHEAEEVR